MSSFVSTGGSTGPHAVRLRQYVVHRYGDTFERLVGDAASICHVAPVTRSEKVSP